jgi:hypothetical protein
MDARVYNGQTNNVVFEDVIGTLLVFLPSGTLPGSYCELAVKVVSFESPALSLSE